MTKHVDYVQATRKQKMDNDLKTTNFYCVLMFEIGQQRRYRIKEYFSKEFRIRHEEKNGKEYTSLIAEPILLYYWINFFRNHYIHKEIIESCLDPALYGFKAKNLK